MPLTRRCAKRGWLASISLPWLIILPWPLTIDHWPWDNAPSSPFSKEMNLPSNVLTRRCAKRRWLASIFLPWQPRSRPNTLRQIEVCFPHPLSATHMEGNLLTVQSLILMSYFLHFWAPFLATYRCPKMCSKIQKIWHQIHALYALRNFTHIDPLMGSVLLLQMFLVIGHIFLATLVALHFTPVSESVSLQSFELA